MKKLNLSLVALFATLHFSYAQSLPIAGGTMTGTAIGPNFIETGSTIDFAPAGILTTNGINTNGGAINRNFNAITKLTAGQYLTVDIGSVPGVSVLAFGTHWSSDTRYIPAGFSIDYSNDNATWTNYTTVTGNTNLHPTYTPNITARYWRLTVNTTQSGITYANIAGLQLISTGIGAAATNYWNTPYNAGSIFTNTPVSIGTSAMPSGYQLAVNGAAIATFMKVKLYANWPDFVFLKEYKLPTLTEVKAYIDKNQHLPDVPSADEVHANGLDLGEMNRLLLKKVEELTLYAIESKEELEKQKKDHQQQIDQLKRQINKITKPVTN